MKIIAAVLILAAVLFYCVWPFLKGFIQGIFEADTGFIVEQKGNDNADR